MDHSPLGDPEGVARLHHSPLGDPGALPDCIIRSSV
jgi:hypothetical protein